MVTRFKRIVEVAGSLVALDTKGFIWMYDPDTPITNAPWRRIASPGEGRDEEGSPPRKGDIAPMFGNR